MILGLLAFYCLISGASALYDINSNVVQLTPDNFNELVINSDDIWVVEFFAPWCGHCQRLVPEFKKAATRLQGVIKVGAVNVEEHREFGDQFQIEGFPTIKIFGANKRKPEDYNGQHRAEDIVDAGLAATRGKRNATNTEDAGEGDSVASSDYSESSDISHDRQEM